MIDRLHTTIVRNRRAIAAVAIAGLAYCLAIEIWLPRQDTLPEELPEVVIALSAGVDDDGTLERAGAARLRTALEIAKPSAATLVTTRDRNKDNPVLLSDAPQRRIVDSAGMSGRWMILDGVAIDTRDEAERFQRVFSPMPIVLVTSRLHTRRACKTFETLGYQVTCVSSGLDGPWWKIPWSVAYETLAWIKYQLEGWI